MTAPWKVRSLAVERLIGYERLEWSGIHPELNLLIGQNGVGKSVLLETIVAGLSFLAGRHRRDLVVGDAPETVVEIQRFADQKPQRFSTADIRAIQGNRDTGWNCQILQVVENRQPKNRVGRLGPPHWDNPIMRYADALARLQRVLQSKADDDVMFAETVKEYCHRIPVVATEVEWERIWKEIRDRGPNAFRPLSCGQFDLLALMLDLTTFRRDLGAAGPPHFVIFDNPETFLHSAALWPTLNVFREALPGGQFFVASHGIRLMLDSDRKTVFFLSREARALPRAQILPLDQLPKGGRDAFFQLYGNDSSSGIASALAELDSPEMYRFLCQCALECRAKERRVPTSDPQLELTVSSLESGPLTILDVGAGHGELLEAFISTIPRSRLTYLAYDKEPQAKLFERIRRAIAGGILRPGSQVLGRLQDAPSDCDAAIFLNLCHHLTIQELAQLLSGTLSQRIDKRDGAGLVVIELRTLAAGERSFILWTPADFAALFAPYTELSVERRFRDGDYPEVGHEASLIRWSKPTMFACPSAPELENRLWELLPRKREALLEELERYSQSKPAAGLATYWYQKRIGFLCAQLAFIAAAEWGRSRVASPIDP